MPCDNINIEQEVDGVVAMEVDEEGHVRLGLDKIDGGQVGGEAAVPGLQCLHEAIQGAVYLTHQIWTSSVDEPGGLAAVDSLHQSVVEEGTLTLS
jgi:hypothetical protein